MQLLAILTLSQILLISLHVIIITFDSINYDEDTQTITMDNTSVDKLREEIKKYYYDSIGLKVIKPVGTVKKYVDSSDFRKLLNMRMIIQVLIVFVMPTMLLLAVLILHTFLKVIKVI